MKNPLEVAVLKTLAYSDIFGYPLTAREVWLYLISDSTYARTAVRIMLDALVESGELESRTGFYVLKGRADLVRQRAIQMEEAARKKKIIDRDLGFIESVSGICLIGLTGKLALGVASPNDDIDIMIITDTGVVWTVRLLASIKLDRKKRRRKPHDVDVKDKFCLNMFLDRRALKMPTDEQDVFSAHELMQMKPLCDRCGIYREFFLQNEWIDNYLANAYQHKIQSASTRKFDQADPESGAMNPLTFRLLRLFEPVSRTVQLRYMQGRITKEVVSEKRIRFHPQDARYWVLPAYQEKIDRLGLY